MAEKQLQAGLYLVATPIGNARDITLRALDLLDQADVLVAEDTRVLRRLLEIHGIGLRGRQLIPHHDHSKPAALQGLVRLVEQGKSMAYCSDAGSPLVADPGYELVSAMRKASCAVHVVPGVSSVVAALSLAGLATDRFCFVGFAPRNAGARAGWLAELEAIPATLVMFETAKRVGGLLEDMAQTLGAGRQAALARELTKRFEEVRRGTLQELAEGIQTDPPKGEIVLVVERAEMREASMDEIESALRSALTSMSVRDAADAVALQTGAKRREVYQLALRLQKDL